MSWRTLFSRHKKLTPFLQLSQNAPFRSSIFHPLPFPPSTATATSRNFHSSRVTAQLGAQLGSQLRNSLVHSGSIADEEDADGTMNEFLSRFVWMMRKKVRESYPDSDKGTVDTMLLVIVERVVSELEKGGFDGVLGAATATFRPGDNGDFSEDLWRTVWEVSNNVIEGMNKERKKEKMKGFLQCDEVKQMCRFAGEVGIRGDLLRELRFKWAREKMEEHEFYEGLECMRKEAEAEEHEEEEQRGTEHGDAGVGVAEEGGKVVGLPKRKGKIRYKIYGLDLSDPKWARVADRIHEAGEVMWPKEAKPITGKSKIVTENILKLKEEEGSDELLRLLAEWVELLQPSRVDWKSLLDGLKQQNPPLYYKVAEIVLTEDSFQTTISDYCRLIDAYAKENRFEDVERMVKKMNEKGMVPDASAATELLHMYCKAGNLERAKQAFEILKAQGFQPNVKVYTALIMAYVNSNDPAKGEYLLREMDTKDVKPTKEIYMALLRAFSKRGEVTGAERISTMMQFAGFQQTKETCTLLVEAHANAGNPDAARRNFDYMKNLGHKPDDRCTASMIVAYEKKNLLDKALELLLKLEKDGFVPGVATYSVLVDWMSRLLLVDEAEHLLGKIAQQGEAPPFKVQVSLCDMYARAGNEKKALQALGAVEARKDELEHADFERIIQSLLAGGFEQDARRMCGIMEVQGFALSESLRMALLKPSRKFPKFR
ncbi:pentatricopeptide repeat-containing protein At1g05670, mitochondrial [Arachis stenosperma]|uniref:pentatricopeptide repeat-containing protein At1g05670, mitochondrial n=1 Tax=Arachis stenosperma TaxID=217475 RepID=UPI0025AC2104|nr:pentatricopeptide repeat-containing protein At1g05670, mitochondrial [Arachis stenosperma]